MTFAVIGVFVMQLYYIREAYNLKTQLFNEQVNQTLSSVVNKLQKHNALNHFNNNKFAKKRNYIIDQHQRNLQITDIKKNYETLVERNKLKHQREIEAELNIQDSIIRSYYQKPIILSESDFKAADARNGQNPNSPVKIDIFANIDDNYNILSGSISTKFLPTSRKSLNFSNNNLPDSIRYAAADPYTGNVVLISLPTVQKEMVAKFNKEEFLAKKDYEQKLRFFDSDSSQLYNENLTQLEDVAKEMAELKVPLFKRIPLNLLDSLLRTELNNNNIHQAYNYKVTLAKKDSTIFIKTANIQFDVANANSYKTALFGGDLIRDPGLLVINFPNKNAAILTNLGATLISSAALILILIFIFSYTLYAILQQKKISEMKTDFINNMTHEFKTPVATIMIASEALKDPEVTEDKNRIKRLAGIIYDENIRLGNHIERVLNIAKAEKEDLALEMEEVDVNDLISIVLDSMALQLQKKNAQVTLDLKAQYASVKGDEFHLSNILYNLIDNANKYSLNEPHIYISTKNIGKNLVIEVKDSGIGMTKDQSKRIFDQFYRVPTGNLHDVKGFGLGLNYVQNIVHKLKGKIKVITEKDKGTTFEIILPLY